MTKSINVCEALCGTQFLVTQLDGRELLIKTEPGKVIKPGELMCVDDEGMPYLGNPFTKGKLFIMFDIKFPVSGSLTPQQCQVLQSVLPPVPKVEVDEDDDPEECILQNVSKDMFGKSGARQSKSAYDSDEDDEGMGGGQRVQCAQQ